MARAAASGMFARLPPPVADYLRNAAADGRLSGFFVGLLFNSAVSICLGPLFGFMSRTPVAAEVVRAPFWKVGAAKVAAIVAKVPTVAIPKLVRGPFEVVLAFKNSVSIPVVILRPAGWVRSLLAKLPLPGAP